MLQVVCVSNCVLFAGRYLSGVSFGLLIAAVVCAVHCQLLDQNGFV